MLDKKDMQRLSKKIVNIWEHNPGNAKYDIQYDIQNEMMGIMADMVKQVVK